MKKIFSILISLIFFSPLFAFAVNTSIPWSRFNGSGEHPSFPTDQILIGASATTTTDNLDVEGSGYFGDLLTLNNGFRVNNGTGKITSTCADPSVDFTISDSFEFDTVTPGGTAYFQGFNRCLSVFTPVDFEALSVTFSAGNVGIGVPPGVQPGTLFEVRGGDSGFGSSTPWGVVGIGSNDATALRPLFAIGSSSLSSGIATSTLFLVNGNGNVGIATSAPYSMLSVAGQIVAKNYIATSSTATSSISTRTGFNTDPLSSIHGGYGQLSIIQKNDLDAGIVMKALPGQTGDFLYTTDSVGNPLQRFTGQGYIMTNRFADITDPSNNYFILNNGGQGIFQTLNGLLVQAFGAPNPTLEVRLNSGQTTNGFELRDFGLTTLLADINSKGGAYFANNTGIGTTSPYATTSIQSNNSTGDAFVIATSSKNAIAGYDNDGHRFTSGPAPAISSCGTGTGTVVGDDQSGDITTATAATACTLTFSKAYRNSPVCTVTDNSLVGFADISSVSTLAVTFGISSALTGGHLYYSCSYHQ